MIQAYTGLCAWLSRWALRAAVLGLILIVLCVQWQVIGRYLFNDTPTWTEGVALLAGALRDDAGGGGGRARCRPPRPGVAAGAAAGQGAARRRGAHPPARGAVRRPDGAQRLRMDGSQVGRAQAHARRARGPGLSAAADRRRADAAVLRRAPDRASARRNHQRLLASRTMELWILCGSFLLLLLLGVPVAFCHRPGLGRHPARRRAAAGPGVPEDGRRHAGVQLPRHPLLHLCRRADAARGHCRAHRRVRKPPGRPCARRAWA